MKQDRDILLLGRPDHSLQIYSALERQDELSFLFITFKVLPKWLKKFIKHKKIQFLGKNVKIGKLQTFIHLCKFKFGFSFAQNWSETNKLGPVFKKASKKSKFKIIHHWLDYAKDDIMKYHKENPDTILIRDIHMPSFQAVYEIMKEPAEKYGLDISEYENQKESQLQALDREQCFIVPSKYVLDTYKRYLPDKTFYTVSYGISKFSGYKKREHIKEPHKFRFVYVGRVSVEKGCDIMFEFFNKHPELELHIYGPKVDGQKDIFNKLMSSNIVYHGSVAKSILQNELNKYDIGIHLSRFDAYGLGLGEILGCGVPVIVSKHTGIETDVRENRLGLVTDNSFDDIEDKVRQLTNIRVYNEFLDSVHRYVNSSPKSYGEKMVEFYLKLIDSKN